MKYFENQLVVAFFLLGLSFVTAAVATILPLNFIAFWLGGLSVVAAVGCIIFFILHFEE